MRMAERVDRCFRSDVYSSSQPEPYREPMVEHVPTAAPHGRGRGPDQLSTIPASPEDRPMICCSGDRICTQVGPEVNTRISRDLCAIAKTFNKDCTQYSQWTDDDKKNLCNEFEYRYQWDPNDTEKDIKRTFNMMAGNRFRNIAYYTRQNAINELGPNIADLYSCAENVKKLIPWWATTPQWIEMCKG